MRAAIGLLLGVFLVTGVALAAPDHTGSDPDVTNEFVGGYPDRECTVYWYPADMWNEVNRFIGLGYDITVGGDLSYANISNYDVLIIVGTGPGSIGAYQPDIEQFVGGGGGLFIHQAGTSTGTVDYAPPDFEFYITYIGFCMPYDVQTIVEPGHPTMAGLTWVDLPGRFDEVHTDDLGAGYTLIAEGGAGCEGDTHCAGGPYMEGLVFMDCSNLGVSSADPGSDQYIINVVDWICTGGGTATESATWGAIKSQFK